MREIGSEFWNVPTIKYDNGVFHNSPQWFLSGRSALQSIIKELVDCKSVSLPSWCCDSMIKPFIDAGMTVSFYPVYWNKELIQEVDTNSDVILLMEYFGYDNPVSVSASFSGIVIRDVTHSVFSNSFEDADYYFGSLRKWCGIWTGGFAWANDGHPLSVSNLSSKDYVELREKAMHEKAKYIADTKTYTANHDKRYLNLFSEAETILDNVGEEAAIERDIYMALHLDVETMKTKRRSNAAILMEAFKDWLLFPELKYNDCPLFVPILIPEGKRNELKQYLINNKIYCPVHWPLSSYHDIEDCERFVYDNELSLVCDQRYDKNDMVRIVEAINDFWKDVK